MQEAATPSHSTLLPNLFAGLISGLTTVIAAISYATLIFSGPLAEHLQLGIAAALTCALIVGLVMARRSSSPYAIAGPDANISAILALIGATAVAKLAGKPPESVAASMWALLAVCSLLAGLFLFLVGRFRLGRWIRYIPYPVVGGFLGGTGLILVQGSFKVMCGKSLTLSNLPDLATNELFIHWLPGALFALALLFVLRRFKHFTVMPSLLLAGIVIAHLSFVVTGTSIQEAMGEGWLLSTFPQDLFFRSYRALSPASIDLSILSAGVGNLFAMMIVATIVILLNSASVELATRQDIDLDGELRASGIANLIAAPFGALTGCMALSRSVLNFKAGAKGRLSGYVSALFCGTVLLVAAPLLALMPKPILGGLLLYLGLSILTEWVIDGWSRLSRLDYFLVIIILVVVGAWSFLPGVATGIVIACLLFAFNYSRVDVVKQSWSGVAYHSNVERSLEDRRFLREYGDQIRILRLQGFIFFGTAYPLLERVRGMIRDAGKIPVRFLVLDFSHVSGIDSSSQQSFARMKDFLVSSGATLLMVGVRDAIRTWLVAAECLPAGPAGASAPGHCMEFADLDHAMGWCENQILESANHGASAPKDVEAQLRGFFPKPELILRLLRYLDRIEAVPNTMLYRQGEPSKDLFFLESGEVTAFLEQPGQPDRRLRTMSQGTVIGEIGLYAGLPRTASVVAEKPSVLYRLSAESFRRIESDDQELALALHRYFVNLLASRLLHANEELSYFMR